MLFFILPLLIAITSVYFLVIKKSTETFSDLVTDTKYPSVSQTSLTSVSDNTINGTGSSIKTLDIDGTLSVQVEANLPLAIGGDFVTENVIYRVFSQDNTPLGFLERHNDGFYRGLYTIPDSSTKDYLSISSLVITASDESGDTPVLSGTF